MSKIALGHFWIEKKITFSVRLFTNNRIVPIVCHKKFCLKKIDLMTNKNVNNIDVHSYFMLLNTSCIC